MLDIKFIREHVDLVKEAARKKRISVDVDRLISLDEERLSLLKDVEELRAQQNAQSQDIQSLSSEVERVQLIESMKVLKDKLKDKEALYKKVLDPWQALMYAIPNIPDVTVPEGESDQENVAIKSWGEKRVFDFQPKDHVEILDQLDALDSERGSRVH